MSENSKLKITKEGSYGLVEQFRKLGNRVALPDLNLYKIKLNDQISYQFTIRNPWYTTTPVSTIMSINLTINGHQINEDKILIVIRDQAIPFSYAKNLHELMWGFAECFQIRVIDQILSEVLTEKNDINIEFTIRTAFEGYHLPNNRITYLFNVNMGVK